MRNFRCSINKGFSSQCIGDTFRSELAAVGDDASLGSGSSGGRADGLEGAQDVVVILGDLTEDDVLAIQVGSGREAEEELRAVRVGAGVGHGEDASASVAVREVLVVESASVDGLATSAVTSGEVATLGHEAGDDTVELGSLEVERLAGLAHALLASAEASEVLSSLGGVRGVESHDDSASSLAADGDVEENLSHFAV